MKKMWVRSWVRMPPGACTRTQPHCCQSASSRASTRMQGYRCRIRASATAPRGTPPCLSVCCLTIVPERSAVAL